MGFIILEKKSPSDVRGFTGFVGDFGLTAGNVSFTAFLAVEVLGTAVFGEEIFDEATGPALGLIVESFRDSFGWVVLGADFLAAAALDDAEAGDLPALDFPGGAPFVVPMGAGLLLTTELPKTLLVVVCSPEDALVPAFDFSGFG